MRSHVIDPHPDREEGAAGIPWCGSRAGGDAGVEEADLGDEVRHARLEGCDYAVVCRRAALREVIGEDCASVVLCNVEINPV